MSRITHEEFNATDADVTFQSSDGVLFRLHRKNLEVNTGAFPGQEFKVDEEAVELSEPASVLEILFQFVYPRRHPELEDKDFKTVVAVADAVEKYEVFTAMYACTIQLKHHLPEHPLEILLHGIKHDYPNLINDSARYALMEPTISIVERLPLTWIIPWLRYQEAAKAFIYTAAKEYIDKKENCAQCHKGCAGICDICRPSVLMWVERISSFREVRSAADGQKQKEHQNLKFCKQCSLADTCIQIPGMSQFCQEAMKKVTGLTNFLPKAASSE